jgi:MFS family permease
MATRGQKSKKVFYGWWIVLVAGIGLSVHHAPIMGFTSGVFLKSLSQEFSWSRTQISLAFTLGALGITLAAPFLGWLVDRFGARRVILPATLAFGVGVLSLYFLSAQLWPFYALSLFMGVVGSGTGPVPYSKVISRWFDRQRGLALGLALVGASVGIAVMPSVAQALITSMGWRFTYVFLGLLTMGITLPVVGLFLTETPQLMGLGPDGEASAAATAADKLELEPGLSGREAPSHRDFLGAGECGVPRLGQFCWLPYSSRSLAHGSGRLGPECGIGHVSRGWRSTAGTSRDGLFARPLLCRACRGALLLWLSAGDSPALEWRGRRLGLCGRGARGLGPGRGI